MSKIKVVGHSKTVGFGGTDKVNQLFCKYLAKSDKYEPFLVYRKNDPNERLDIVKQWLGDDHVIGYEWEPGESGRNRPCIPQKTNFDSILRDIRPDIIHLHRSGYQEWPGFRFLYPEAKWVETNIFGEADLSGNIDLTIYISDHIKERAMQRGNKPGPTLYNPVEQPFLDVTIENKQFCREQLLDEFKFPRNSVLLGRVGRPDNFDPISLKAFREIEKHFPDVYYIVVNPCENWKRVAEELGIQNVRFRGPIIGDDKLSNFYTGLDIYAHARSDGECCPCNIQEAMMHKLPIVSHESPIYNGQSEIICNAGFVVPIGDYEKYAEVLAILIENTVIMDEGYQIRDFFALEARRRAMRYFEASCITDQLSRFYDWVLSN